MLNASRAMLVSGLALAASALKGIGLYPRPRMSALPTSAPAKRSPNGSVARDKRTASKRRNRLRHKQSLKG